jgi:predicted nucleic acid-binding protein
MGEYLLDASSFIKALKLKRPDAIAKNYIQWLTAYEVLNAIWKEAHLMRTIREDKALELASLVKELVGYAKVLDIKGFEEKVLKTALQLGLTAYDASYVVLAEEHGLTLVTEDEGLKEKAREVVKVVSVDDVLRSRPA